MEVICRESNHVETEIPRPKKLKTVDTMLQTGPHWLQLPTNVNRNILQRLSVVDIVIGASLVSPLWWQICKEPTMWHTIDMRYNRQTSNSDLVNICMFAIH